MVDPPPHPHELLASSPDSGPMSNGFRVFALIAAIALCWGTLIALALSTRLGSWLLPSGASITAYVGAMMLLQTSGAGRDLTLDRAIDLIVVLIATIIALAVWLVWALV
jgi:hypothetical protein